LKATIAWFASNRVAANLLMVLILVAGALSLPDIRKEIIPNVELDIITISVAYPGASPIEVEKAISTKIEEKIHDLDGVKKLSSKSMENMASVTVEVMSSYDTTKILDEVKSRVDSITNFPADSERPDIREISIRNRVVNLVISGPTDELSLKQLAEQVRDDLVNLPSITQVELVNVRPYEISINISEAALYRYQMSFAEVADALRRSSLDLAGGVLKTKEGDILLRTQGQKYRGEEFEQVLLRAESDGSRITMADVATVSDGFEESDLIGKFNGEPGVVLTVYRAGEQSILEISDQVRDYMEVKRAQLPKNIKLNIWQDRSRIFKGRMKLLIDNATIGLLLVFTILVIFLRWRLAFWVSVGIAISFMGTFWVLPYAGGSINMISMFAFVLVLGIVVDDAIIVGENIYTHNRGGDYGVQGAINGAQDVAMPVVFAVFTSVAAFMPILFLPGTSGKLWMAIPVVVIATLIFSLLESLLILPAHLSGLRSVKTNESKIAHFFSAKQQAFANAVERFIYTRYRPFLAFALRWRYATVAIFLSILMIFLAILFGGWLRLAFFPKVEGDMMVATVSFAQGTHISTTEISVNKMQQAAIALKEQLRNETGGEEIQNMITTVGSQPMGRTGITGGHVGEVALELVPAEYRSVSNAEIMRRWRESVGEILAAQKLSFKSTMGHSGPGISMELSGLNLDKLESAADALKLRLREYPGVYDVQDSFQNGKQEVQLGLKPQARDLGVNLQEMARQVRQAFYGEEVQRIQRGRDEVKVFVRYPKVDRQTLFSLENMIIRLKNGAEVPLLSVAEVQYNIGPSLIERIDRKRIIKVTAYVDESKTTTGQVMDDLRANYLPAFETQFNSVKWDISGSQKDQKELIDSMINGFVLSILGIYALMAIPFRSYLQPIMVLSAVPFGLIGAIIGHMILGLDVSLLSLSGMIAVSGVVVNDNLVLVDFINRQRRRGVAVAKAIREAGAARFRPILLTSLTTFAGLTPLMLEKSVQAQFLIPMAVSLAFGVMIATVVSLILVPASYHILEDLKSFRFKTPTPLTQQTS